MAYQTYTTDALVCGTFDRNTADRSYLLFTRDAGMLYASARSVREERSRQRYALQDFSLVRVSLVKGKAGWRIGSIEAKRNYYHDAANKAARGSVVSWFRFLRRFVGGEEPQSALFAESVAALGYLSGELIERHYFELVVKIRVLQQLGYVAPADVPAGIIGESLAVLAIEQMMGVEQKLEQLYAQAERASHL
jgi:recombinational DNA repair protein (RecF pathway)